MLRCDAQVCWCDAHASLVAAGDDARARFRAATVQRLDRRVNVLGTLNIARFLAKPEFQKFPFGHGLTFGASFVYSSPKISVAHVPVATVNGVVKAADAPRTRYIAAALARVSAATQSGVIAGPAIAAVLLPAFGAVGVPPAFRLRRPPPSSTDQPHPKGRQAPATAERPRPRWCRFPHSE